MSRPHHPNGIVEEPTAESRPRSYGDLIDEGRPPTLPQTKEPRRTRLRLAASDERLNPRQAVCIAVYGGDGLSHEVFGANQRGAALRLVDRMRRQGQRVRAVWQNLSAVVCGELWVKDLARPLGANPSTFYGSLVCPT